jgi:cobyrinic acid a,c-diamide synthase
VVVAAPWRGAGKTVVTMGLIAACRSRGLTVSAHKVGPDYVDPGYLGLAARAPARNLDTWLTAEQSIAPLFLHGAGTAAVSFVEGATGLFDGVPGGADGLLDFASTAHVSRLLAAPVLLVVDVASQSRSVAALVRGFATFDPAVRIGGVVLNRVDSDRHERSLRDALESIGMPVLGALRHDDRLALPSRHLGLAPVAERSAEALGVVAAAGELVAGQLDVGAVLALAASAPRISCAPWDPYLAIGPTPRHRTGERPRIAFAAGPASTFGYTEHIELLRAAGAEVVTVDPCNEEALPPRTTGLIFGGGFPEAYAKALSDNEMLRKDVADLAASGGVVLGEGAGLLYLSHSLAGAPMCGVLAATATAGPNLTQSYRRAVAASDSVLCAAGTVLRGHEFHRTITPPSATAPAWYLTGSEDPDTLGAAEPEGHVLGRVHASYLNLHWAGRPRIARRVVAAATRVDPAARALATDDLARRIPR